MQLIPMAWKLNYVCTACGYSAEVYEGKGFMGQRIVMMSCPDCKNLTPLVVGGVIGDVAPSFNSVAGRLCLQCGSDRVREWNGRSCPRCGGAMQRQGDHEFWT